MSDIEQRLRAGPEVRVIEDGSGAWEMDPDTTGEIMREAADEITRLEADNASLRSKLEEAEGALEPFAFGDSDIADILWGNLPDDASMKTTAPLGAYRRARRTLASLREADHA